MIMFGASIKPLKFLLSLGSQVLRFNVIIIAQSAPVVDWYPVRELFFLFENKLKNNNW